MNRRAATFGIWLAIISPAGAHRLDEYLQATRLSVGIARVEVEIDLTPGILLASNVFGWIDTNRDGQISDAEGLAYARAMLRSTVLKADGAPVQMTLEERSFPTFDAMSEGIGTIRLRATAAIPPAAPGRHQISFLNMHRPESSVYLVNVLVPENPRLQFGEQRRDVAQHGLTLDYTLRGDAPQDRTLALFLGLAMAGCLFLRHGPLRRDRGLKTST
ncbi:MAG TPA: hypothetical protein VMT15_01535 [Bryobacteraceae bacterium]|nr:hypothetical protein [Bryobacteraceae bacterium]